MLLLILIRTILPMLACFDGRRSSSRRQFVSYLSSVSRTFEMSLLPSKAGVLDVSFSSIISSDRVGEAERSKNEKE